MNTFQKELYTDLILKIKCGSYKGKKIKAKPILLYSLLEMIEDEVVKNNQIHFGKETEDAYKKVFERFEENITPLFKPFFYFQFDGFWHLQYRKDCARIKNPSSKSIKECVEFAYLDNPLWDLLQNEEIRSCIRTLIENNYLK